MEGETLHWLATATLFSACAIAVALALRKALRALFGPIVAYRVWQVVPVALLAVLLPVHPATPSYLSLVGTAFPFAQHAYALVPPDSLPVMIGLLAWVLGACFMLVILFWQQARFVRGLTIVARRNGILYAQHLPNGPLVVGILCPQIVVSLDFQIRYTPSEQQVVIAHERMHVRRGDPIANAICAFLRCAFWFNPLVHFAASRFRFDQELACDEAVIRHFPTSQQSYASAMLKTHLANSELPLACHWPSRHPLKARILMLKKPPLCRGRRALGSLITGLAVITIGFVAWAAQPDPGNTLSLQGMRDNNGALVAHAGAVANSCWWVRLRAYRRNIAADRFIAIRMGSLGVGLAALRERTAHTPQAVRDGSADVADSAGRSLEATQSDLTAESAQLVLVLACRLAPAERGAEPLLLALREIGMSGPEMPG